MNAIRWRHLVSFVGVVALLASCGARSAEAQTCPDPNLNPTYGSINLYAGFTPDPRFIDLTAGGEVRMNLGGVNSSVACAPDFRVYYTAGTYALTFYVESGADTTLLINLPDGRWIANDDSGGNLNPLIRLPRPMSGRYDIWVGTYNGGYAPARLFVTELR